MSKTQRCSRGLVLAAGAVAMMACATLAYADVTYHQGTSEIGVSLGIATFDDLQLYDPLESYQEGGLTFLADADSYYYPSDPPGFPAEWGSCYYAVGLGGLLNITRADGGDFEVLEMNVSDGWSDLDIWVWMQAYLDGGLVAEFDPDVQGGTLIGLTGQFDELRIGAYYSEAHRDLHDPTMSNGIALDNVGFGLVPEPATLSLLALGGLAVLRRRRA